MGVLTSFQTPSCILFRIMNSTMYAKKLYCFINLLTGLPVAAQEQKPVLNDSISDSHTNNIDQRFSVFGPPRPAFWKIQLSGMKSGNQTVSSFNFYQKNQRDKILFFSILNNGLDNTSQYRVQQVSGGAIFFPFNNDALFYGNIFVS